MASAAVLTSAGGVLALLEEPEEDLQEYALNQLNEIVDEFWPEIADFVQDLEKIFESKGPQSELAALVTSKVYYHLGEYDDAVSFALGAGSKLDIEGTSEYVLTMVSKCIDLYTDSQQGTSTDPLDPRLVAIVERMFLRCIEAKAHKQLVGLSIETRRTDILERALTECDDQADMLQYCFKTAMSVIVNRGFRNEVLRILARLYRSKSSPDYFGVIQCQIFLDDAFAAAGVLLELLNSNQAPFAYQIAFDLYNAATQQFLNTVRGVVSENTASEESNEKKEAAGRVQTILLGTYTLEVYKEFLSRSNHADKLILTNTKDALSGNSIYHSALVMSNAMMYAGTTQDPFLRDNTEWLRRASNWAKFNVVASLGVIHKGHTAMAKKVLEPYLPGTGTEGGGPYLHGGAYYALGLIHANHGSDSIISYLTEKLNDAAGTEVTQHGCCLGLGLAAMSTRKEDIFNQLKDKMAFDNSVVGEAAAIGMGLVMLGSNDSEVIDVMHDHAVDTEHEKIIRGIAIGMALVQYGREEEADDRIDALLADQDPILRMGGCHTIATAYAGTSSNKVIRKLLHVAVSDVSNDVRRSAVTSLGFVLCRTPEKLPSTVMLLCESFNPHVRYGCCMALGIACAGSGNAEAISLVEPLLKDTAGYVRQGACIAMALIMMQQRNDHPKAKSIRDHYIKVIGDKHQDVLSKFGAIYAQGILESGGRNVTVRLINEEGHLRLQSVVGMLIFTQFWFWFPLGHFISLAFTPTALVCVNPDLKMPVNIKIRSNAPPSHFAYPPMTEPPKEKSKEKVETAVLSITSKVKAQGKQRKSEGGTSGDGPEKMDVDKPAGEGGDKETDSKKEGGDSEAKKDGEDGKDGKEGEKEKEKEADFEFLKNPARVLPAQLSVVTFAEEERYSPVRSGPVHSGVIVMTDKKTGEPEELIEITKGPEEVANVAEEAKPPEPFTFDPELEDESM